MVVVERFIGSDIYLIKKLVNEVSSKYDNFNHFAINYINSKENCIILYLYFNECDLLKNNERVYVEYLKDVYYQDVKEVIRNSSVDFDGYLNCDVIRNNKKDWLSDIVLTYKVKEFNGDLNLKFIKKISGGGSDGSIYKREENFEFYNYLGNDYYDGYTTTYNVGWNLMFKYARDHIMVLKDYYRDNEEKLFKVSVAEDNECKIKITKFVNENENFYGSPVKQLEYKEVNVDDIMSFVIDLINSIEYELKIKISKPTFKYFENKLIDELKYINVKLLL